MFGRIERTITKHEDAVTVALVLAAIALIVIAFCGKAEHKAALLIYVLLP